MSNPTQDPIELLRQIAPALQNGHKEKLTQAATLVKQLIAERDQLAQTVTAAPLPEAPASVNFKMVHVATQAECLFTLRDHSEADLQQRLQRRISDLVDSGWVAFDVYVDQCRAEREARPPTSTVVLPATAPGQPPLASLPLTGSVNQGEELTFSAQTLSAETKDGKTYWKVKGGKFSQHGVRIWPEALAASGFDPDQLDKNAVYNVAGYTATYTLNDKGNPSKVVGLSR